MGTWKNALDGVDRVLELVGQVKRGTPWFAAGLAALLALRPQPAGGWLHRALAAWRSMRGP